MACIYNTKLSKKHRSAFSLIELLVVISIIILLASITLPSIGEMKEQGKSMKCVSDQRQFHTFITLVVVDEGEFPSWNDTTTGWGGRTNIHRGWGTKHTPQGLSMICPSARQGLNIWNKPLRSIGVNPTYMQWRRNGTDAGGNPIILGAERYPLSIIRRPSEIIMIGDSGQSWPTNPRVSPFIFSPGWGLAQANAGSTLTKDLPLSAGFDGYMKRRHSGSVNTLSVDGSASSNINISQLKERNFYLNY